MTPYSNEITNKQVEFENLNKNHGPRNLGIIGLIVMLIPIFLPVSNIITFSGGLLMIFSAAFWHLKQEETLLKLRKELEMQDAIR